MNRHPALPQQNALSRMFAETGRAFEQNDFARAAEILERAHRIAPRDHKILLDLGYACALGYEFDHAQRWFDQGLKLAPNKAAALMIIADRWTDVRQFDAAGKAYEELVASLSSAGG